MQKSLFALCALTLFFCFTSIFLIIILSVLQASLTQLYGQLETFLNLTMSEVISLLSAVIAAVSVLVALVVYWLNARATRNANRKQHTIEVLLKTRHSADFQAVIEKRRAHFPNGSSITFKAWSAATGFNLGASTIPHKTDSNTQISESAWAVITLLNYYEFLAVCIEEGELDEMLLYKSVRSIMCNLVHDCRDLIAALQEENSTTFEHLSRLYMRWRKVDAQNQEGMISRIASA